MRRPDPPWLSDDTLVMVAEDINFAIPDAIARRYELPPEQLTPDRGVAPFQVHDGKAPGELHVRTSSQR